MSNAAQKVETMTAEDFIAWRAAQPCRDVELLDGEIVAMVRELRRHAVAKFAIGSQIRAQLGPKDPCQTLVEGLGVRIADDTVFQPDVTVECGPRSADDQLSIDVALVVEVLSPSNSFAAMLRRVDRYFTLPSLKAALFVNLDPAEATLILQNGERRYFERDGVVELPLADGRTLTLALEAVFDEAVGSAPEAEAQTEG